MSNHLANFQYLALLRSCSTIDHLKQIHAHAIISGPFRFVFTASKILACSALAPYGDVGYAASVFARIPAPGVFDFNIIMMGFLGDLEHGKAVSVYARMCRESVIHFELNIGNTYALAFSGLSSQNPGGITIANAIFGTKPPISADVLTKAFQMDKKAVDYLQALYWFDNSK